MSIHPQPIEAIPDETYYVAHAAFPKGKNSIMLIRDHMPELFKDEDFVEMYHHLGQPAYSPWRLALVSVFQFLENLTDRQAADAVRGRIDWKYALSLPLDDPGFDFSILSEFRKRRRPAGARTCAKKRMVDQQEQDFILNKILDFCKESGIIKTNSKQRTDSTHVLARIRHLNRLNFVGETVRAALNELSRSQPAWLATIFQLEWDQRYTHRVEDTRWSKSETQLVALGKQVGADGQHILDAINRDDMKKELLAIPAICVLAKVWQQQFNVAENGIELKPSDELAASGELITSPYDDEATFSKKGHKSWGGPGP
jgi:transposase